MSNNSCPTCGKEFVGSPYVWRDGATDYCSEACRDAATHGWISVKDRLPELDREVLGHKDTGAYCIVSRVADESAERGYPWMLGDNWHITEGSITHWQTLPSPPEAQHV